MTTPAPGARVLAVLAAAALAAPAAAQGKTELQQDITVKSRPGGPGMAVPPPAASKPVIEEVLRSLDLARDERSPSTTRIRVGGDPARFEKPFPEPPYLALSPANIEALYDSWTFEVFADREPVWRAEGVGLLRERLEWEGQGPTGGLALSPGKSYRYRFTGRRGGRAFTIESEPVRIDSFVHREYVGETRLEVLTSLVFEPDKAVFAKTARPYLEQMAERLRLGEPRPDGTFKLELYVPDARARLAQDRAKALVKRLSDQLVVAHMRVKVALIPETRGESLACFLAATKGPGLRPD
ncbi:MAG: hypothetical protein SF051_09065 [Elusimicrobiota bacterium]|nr:hypothetical protein [Elusimicrobiota bacterium]